MSELDDLIAEQKAEIDSHYQRPEDQTISFDSMGENASVGDYIGSTDTYFAGTDDEMYSFGDGEQDVYSFLPPQKGTVLVEGASWHGTRHGYTRKECRCAPCTEANKLYHRKLRARRKAA